MNSHTEMKIFAIICSFYTTSTKWKIKLCVSKCIVCVAFRKDITMNIHLNPDQQNIFEYIGHSN